LDLKTKNINNSYYITQFDEMLKVTNNLIELSKLPYTFTQEMTDQINETLKAAKVNKVYTVEELNNLPQEKKERAIYCYTTGKVPGK
jgi:hypothetical protein